VEYPQTGHEVRRNLLLSRSLGIPPQGEQLEFPLVPDDQTEAGAICDEHGLSDYVCVHAGARYRTRRWPAERFAAVANELAAEGYGIVLTGSSEETELVARVSDAMVRPHLNLAGRTSLGGLAALLQRAQLLVTNDTGVSHVGVAVGVDSVVIVSGSDPHRWAPLDRKRHTVMCEPIECRPCGHDVCPIGHPCATRITVQAVLRAARQRLKDLPRRPRQARPPAYSTYSTIGSID
jgi:ADP-heptose:LPS heptosyltransferase